MRIKTPIFIVLVLVFLPMVYGQSEEYAFENPFYEDCSLLDWGTLQYLKDNNLRTVTRTYIDETEMLFVEEYFYNERFVLDSTRLNMRRGKRLTIYTYDSLNRLTSKLDSMSTNNVADSSIVRFWSYNEDGSVLRVGKQKTIFHEHDKVLFRFYPTIEFDTTIGDMTRYVQVDPLVYVDTAGLDQNTLPYHYWIREGQLVLKGTSDAYERVDIVQAGDGMECKYYVHHNDSTTLLRVSAFDSEWQPVSSKLFHNNEWVELEDYRYDAKRMCLLKEVKDVNDNMVTTTTYTRETSSGKLMHERTVMEKFGKRNKSVYKGLLWNIYYGYK